MIAKSRIICLVLSLILVIGVIGVQINPVYATEELKNHVQTGDDGSFYDAVADIDYNSSESKASVSIDSKASMKGSKDNPYIINEVSHRHNGTEVKFLSVGLNKYNTSGEYWIKVTADKTNRLYRFHIAMLIEEVTAFRSAELYKSNTKNKVESFQRITDATLCSSLYKINKGDVYYLRICVNPNYAFDNEDAALIRIYDYPYGDGTFNKPYEINGDLVNLYVDNLPKGEYWFRLKSRYSGKMTFYYYELENSNNAISSVGLYDSQGNIIEYFEKKPITYGGSIPYIAETNVEIGEEYYVKFVLSKKNSGNLAVLYKLKPTAPIIKSVKSQKRAFTVSWQKIPFDVTSYRIQYSTSRNFKKAKSVYIYNNGENNLSKIIHKKIGNLKSSKKYYIRVKQVTYVEDVGSFSSSWSKVKTVKVK